MSMRIEAVDPLPFADAASAILRASWKIPCLHYSADYISWQFSFPSELPNRGAIAFIDDQPVGCAAVTPRRFAHGAVVFSAYVLSFVAVAPSARGRALASHMYSTLLEMIPSDVPVLAFTEPSSIGERLLLGAVAKASFKHRALRICRNMGYIERPNEQAADARVVATVSDDYNEFAFAQSKIHDEITVWNAPTAQQWEHYRADTRSRGMLVLRDDHGRAVGTAMAVVAEVLSSQGVQGIPMLENIALMNNSPDALIAAFRGAAHYCQSSSMVLAPNLSCVDANVLKKAGARTIGSAFNAHLFGKTKGDLLAGATQTNNEVI